MREGDVPGPGPARVDADPDVAFGISGRTSSPSTQVKSATRGGISERFSSPSNRGNPAVPTAIEDEAGLQLESALGLEIEDAQRDLVACRLDRFDLVVEANVHPLPSGRGGQGLVEVVAGHLEGLRPLPGEDIGEQKRSRLPSRNRAAFLGWYLRATTASSRPAAARMSLHRGNSDSPIWNRGRVPASRVMTPAALPREERAATLPAGPAPMMRTSASMGRPLRGRVELVTCGPDLSQPTVCALRLRRTR